MIASSNSSPPRRIALVTTIPPREITEISLVPPPISQTIWPAGSKIGILAPIAAARDSSITRTSRAPAFSADSITARFSTSVMQEGTPMTIRGLTNQRRWSTFEMKYRIIFSVVSRSAITPSRKGLIAIISPGVFQSIRLASAPTATTFLVPLSTATTEGSLITIPLPRTYTRVLQVPKSIPISVEKASVKRLNAIYTTPPGIFLESISSSISSTILRARRNVRDLCSRPFSTPHELLLDYPSWHTLPQDSSEHQRIQDLRKVPFYTGPPLCLIHSLLCICYQAENDFSARLHYLL